jgi:Flp pilus assembly protein CpaB
VKRSNRLLMLLGLMIALLGGGAAFAISSGGGGGGSASASATPTPEPTTTVVIAKQDINLGDKITAEMLDVKTMTISQRAALGEGTFTSTEQVIGKVAGGKILANQPLLGSRDFLNPGTITEGKDIAGAIESGMVGVALDLDMVNGVGTLLVPGDRIDIILSVYVNQVSLKGTDQDRTITLEGGQAVTTKMVIQNRKVLVTLLPQPETQPTAAAVGSAPAAEPTTAGGRNNDRHMIAIVEVKPGEAEVIRWAQRAEKLDPQNYITLGLALRSDKDNDIPHEPTNGVTFKMLVDKWGVLPPDPRAILPPDIAKGIQW